MKQRTWPDPSEGSHFSALPLANQQSKVFYAGISATKNPQSNTAPETASSRRICVGSRSNSSSLSSSSTSSKERKSSMIEHDFSLLPFDVVAKIAASFSLPNLRSASMVCRAWRDALRPLREAMLFLRWGKRFKHGRGGVCRNLQKALDSFLKGAARGSTLAMVDAGLLYWEMGYKDEGIALYRKAASLGDPAGQCNLGISYLQAETPNPKEAVRWLYQAAFAGHVRAQYQLALCLHQGRGVDCNLLEAAKWYLRAAEGGYVRAMYNTSLCYSFGEGLVHSHKQAKKWMKRAADRGHSKAQFEHGLSLFSEGEMMKAVIYLELATRAGEIAAEHIKNVIIQQLPQSSHERAMVLADNWRPLPSH